MTAKPHLSFFFVLYLNMSAASAQIQSFGERMQQLQHRGSSAVLVSMLKGFDMLVHGPEVDKYVSASIIRDRDYGLKTAKFLEVALQRAAKRYTRTPIALDMGANLGFHTVNMARFGAHVISWECVPDNLRLLNANIQLAGVRERVQVIGAAVSDRVGTAKLSLTAGSPAASSLGTASKLPWTAQPTLEVATSNVLADLQRMNLTSIDAIKMDVEGHEITVLRALGPLTRFGVTHITTEFFPALLRANGNEPATLIHMLQEQGFIVSSSWPKLQQIHDAASFSATVERKGTHADLYCVLKR